MSTRTPTTKTTTTRRPREVQQLIACLTHQHCWSNGGCGFQDHCSGGGPEALDVYVLIDYLEELEDRVASAGRD